MGLFGGQSTSISLASTQDVENKINTVSKENCITACTADTSGISINIEDSDIEGNISVGTVCNILGSSCTLKASLSTSVQNTLKNQQTAKTVSENDPLNVLGSLFGQSSTTNETSNQSTSNRVSNIMNATCQNKSTSKTSGVNIQVEGSKVGGNVTVGSTANVSNAKCILDNVSRTTVSNNLSNKQSAKIFQGSPILFAIIGVVIIIVVVMIGAVILGVGGLAGLGIYEGTKKSPLPPGLGPGGRPMGPPGGRPMGPPGGRPMGPPGGRPRLPPRPQSYRVR